MILLVNEDNKKNCEHFIKYIQENYIESLIFLQTKDELSSFYNIYYHHNNIINIYLDFIYLHYSKNDILHFYEKFNHLLNNTITSNSNDIITSNSNDLLDNIHTFFNLYNHFCKEISIHTKIPILFSLYKKDFHPFILNHLNSNLSLNQLIDLYIKEKYQLIKDLEILISPFKINYLNESIIKNYF